MINFFKIKKHTFTRRKKGIVLVAQPPPPSNLVAMDICFILDREQNKKK